MKQLIKKFYLRVRIKLKHAFDAINNERLKINLLQAIPFWIGSVLTGLIAVLYATLFRWAEEASKMIFNTGGWLFFFDNTGMLYSFLVGGFKICAVCKR